MGAPSVTARQVPTGYKLPDGFKTTIAFANKPAVQFWEKTVQPPGFDGGEKIDTTTMLNTTWRTMAARQLKTLTDCEVSAAYDPDVFPDILGLINVPQAITVHFPDNSTLAFYGFLQKFVPDAMEEGKFPEAKLTITPTNWDLSAGTEAAPVFTAATGT